MRFRHWLATGLLAFSGCGGNLTGDGSSAPGGASPFGGAGGGAGSVPKGSSGWAGSAAAGYAQVAGSVVGSGGLPDTAILDCPTNLGLIAPDPTNALGGACTTDSDCTLKTILTCGPHFFRVMGRPSSHDCRAAPVTDCGEPGTVPPTYETDDRRSTADPSEISVHCEGGMCLSSGPRCGGELCPPDSLCVQSCGDGTEICLTRTPSCRSNSEDCAKEMCSLADPNRHPPSHFGVAWWSPRDVYCMAAACGM